MKKLLQILLLSLLAVALLLTSGCAAPTAAPEPTATSTPVPTATDTPPPTETPAPTSTATPAPTATRDMKATLAAKSTQRAVRATEEAIDLVRADLAMLELSPEEGTVRWVSEAPISTKVDQYNYMQIFQVKQAGEVGDFVMKTKITWDSTSGFAGCAVKFRAEEDFKNGAYYAFQMMRLQYQPGWGLSYVKFNQVQTDLSEGIKFTDKIEDEKNSTNDVLIVARGSEITIYINGAKVKTVKNEKLKKGLVGFYVWQESGVTSCKFHDGWIWEFNEPVDGGA